MHSLINTSLWPWSDEILQQLLSLTHLTHSCPTLHAMLLNWHTPAPHYMPCYSTDTLLPHTTCHVTQSTHSCPTLHAMLLNWHTPDPHYMPCCSTDALLPHTTCHVTQLTNSSPKHMPCYSAITCKKSKPTAPTPHTHHSNILNQTHYSNIFLI